MAGLEAASLLLHQGVGSDASATRPYGLLPVTLDVDAIQKDAAYECGLRIQDIEDVYPCTPLQAALMISTSRSAAAYICQYAYAVLPSISVERLRHAWDLLKASEPVLRNRIIWNCSTQSFLQATVTSRCCSSIEDDFEGNMTLGQDLCRAKCVKDTESYRWKFQIRIHHSILDGWSLQLLLQKLKECYQYQAPLVPGPPFTKFVYHIASENSPQNPQTLTFWCKYLSEALVVDFPKLPSTQIRDSTTTGTKSLVVPLNAQKLVAKFGVSPATGLYAAAAIILSAHSGCKDVIFGLTLSGRDASIAGIDEIIGPTIATVPFRTQVEQDVSLHWFLNTVQSQTLELIPYQHCGLQNIKNAGIGAKLACQLRTHVIVQPRDQTIANNGLFEKAEISNEVLTDDFPLSIEFIIGEDQISINCGFDSACIQENEVDVVLSHLNSVLQELWSLSPWSKISTVRLADDFELARISAWAKNNVDNHALYATGAPGFEGSSIDANGEEVERVQWVARVDNEGQIWPAPILCPGKIAVAAPSLDSELSEDLQSLTNYAINAPDLSSGPIPSRFHLTGDIGCYQPDGNVRILGRTGRTMTGDGAMANRTECEHQLRVLGGIFANCVVDCVDDDSSANRLAAFIDVGVSGDEVCPEGLIVTKEFSQSFKDKCLKAQQQLSNVLRRSSVPTLFVPVSHIPITHSGRADLKRLTDAFGDSKGSRSAFLIEGSAPCSFGRLPQTKSELEIEAAFQGVFGIIGRLTTSDSFFQLGGDSFTAINLVAAAKKRKYSLSISQIYQNPRLGDLANIATPCPEIASEYEATYRGMAANKSDLLWIETARLCNLSKEEIEDIYSVSALQEGFAATMFRELGCQIRSSYVATIALSIPEQTDFARLTTALEVVIARNPIFRTRFVHTSKGTMQVVCKECSWNKRARVQPSEEKIGSGLNPIRFEEGSPLLYYQVAYSDTHQASRLLLTIHHGLYDAWTLDKFLDDLNYNYSHPQQERQMRVCGVLDESTGQHAKDSSSFAGNLDLSCIKGHGISGATVIAAAWALLLASYCNEQDVCYGTVLSGRDEAFLEDVMGPTISTVPLRISFDKSETKHQHFGLESIARLPTDGPQNASKFNSLLVMQQATRQMPAETRDPLLFDIIENETTLFLDYPLIVSTNLNSSTGEISIQIQYDSSCISAIEVQRMMRHLHHVAEQLVKVRSPISQIEIVTREDTAEILSWNPLPGPYSPSLLHGLFEQMVFQQPQATAVESTPGPSNLYSRLSYRQLDDYANRLSLHIVMRDASQSFVAICLEKSPLAVIAMIATLKAGRAFVPLDPSVPTARIQAILDTLGKNAILVIENNQVERFRGSDLLVLDKSSLTISWETRDRQTEQLSFEDAMLPSMNDKQFPSETSPDSTAYILHTSGSTGQPKGIVVSHSSSATALICHAQRMMTSSDVRILQNASFMFDLSVMEIFLTLISGGCICMITDTERLAGELGNVTKQLRVNLLFLTPTMALLMQPDDFSCVQTLVFVGETPTRQLLERWGSCTNPSRILNGYGPAEAGFVSCINMSLDAKDPRNIGQPVGCQLFVADIASPDRLAAIGAPGELIVCGEIVADGYLKNPETTSQYFGIDLPWMTNRHGKPSRYYRTGDLVKYNADGSLHYLGRKDLQRKIHGQRLELEEIEHHISTFGRFHGVVVEMCGADTLAAFLKMEMSHGVFGGLSPPETLELGITNELNSYLESRLPSYMIPSVHIPIAHFATTTSGKIDRRRMRLAAENNLESYRYSKTNLKRQDETESQTILKQLWAEAIPIAPERIGIDDGFFALGGTSISVIRLLMAARKRQLKLEVGMVYQRSTLSEMAALLEVRDQPDLDENIPQPFSLMKPLQMEDCISLASEKCNVPKSSVVNVYPCSYMQEAMMLFSEKHPGSFYVQNCFRVSNVSDVQKLLDSLKVVWLRHDSLRTRIILDNDFRSLQVVVDETLDVPLLDLDLNKYLSKDTAPRYGEPLSRCAVLVSAQICTIVVCLHHAIFDAWSLDLLLQDIRMAYLERLPPLAEAVSFSSFIHNALQVQGSSPAAQYWQELLLDARTSRLPQVKKTNFLANQEYTEMIDLPANLETSLSTTVEAAWAILLGQYTGSEDVCFGVVRSGRTASVNGIATIMGPTIVSIPRRLRPIKTLPVSAFLTQVERVAVEAMPWEQYGLHSIRQLSESARQACDFQSMIVIQHHPESLQHIDEYDLDFKLIEQHGTWSDNCLTLECRPQRTGKVSVSLSYDDTAIVASDVRWISHYFCRLLSMLTTKAIHAIGELDIAGPETVRQTLLWNQRQIPRSDRRVEGLFSERLKAWPLAVAIDAADVRLTYQELDELSSSLASNLRAFGVSRGNLVPLCLEKSAAMIIAILGVLKAGGTFVPMEVDHPIKRLCYIVREVGAEVILCTPNQEAICNELGSRVICVDVAALKQGLSASNVSGTTGVPKGVMVEHGALSTTILERAPRLGHRLGLRCLLFSSYTFDSSIWETFAPLLHGGCLFIPSNEQRLAALPEYLNEKRIEMMASTPTVVQNILQSSARFPHLKALDLGGEAMTKAIIYEWSEKVRLINDYGPTEVCIDACHNDNVSRDTDPNNIGYADGTGCRLWVVEPADRAKLTPVGCNGELLISGPTLARGYLNGVEKTSKAFIDCSAFEWVMKGDERCYATGDIVCRNGDGSLTFIGRQDMQMQLHGIRIEVEEIEFVLGSCEGVRSAVVDKVTQEGTGTEMLVAFLLIEAIGDKNPKEILHQPSESIRSIINDASIKVQGRLPKYMNPRLYLPLRQIPTSTGGKVDRKQLQKLYDNTPPKLLAKYKFHSVSKRSPNTELQKELQRLWGQVLGNSAEHIGLDDDFLILGGDSLAAIKLATLAARKGLRLEATDIFRSTRFEEMAAHIQIGRLNGFWPESKDPAPFSLLDGSDVLSTTSHDQDDLEDIVPATSVQTSFIARAQKCDTVFGSIVSGRNAPFEGSAEVVGPCLNLIPVRLKIDPSLTFMDLMKQAYDQQVAMIPYESTPIEQIVRQSPWSSSTRFGSVVLHQNIPPMAQEEAADGPKWKYAGAAGYGEIMFDYTDCWLTTLPMGDDCMKFWLSFNEEALPMSAADSIIDYFLAVIAMISDHPDSEIHTLGSLTFNSGVYQEPQAAVTPISPHPNSISNPRLPEDVISRLQTLWKEVLSSAQSSQNSEQTATIEENASFFDHGGDSIAAIQLARLCADSDIDLLLQDIYDFPTLSSQYQLLSGDRQRINRESPELIFVSADEIPA
ncbi:MAG: hypothetical protein Q9166_006144 [cf. Caloplaca sp. 2 TL-2023]